MRKLTKKKKRKSKEYYKHPHLRKKLIWMNLQLIHLTIWNKQKFKGICNREIHYWDEVKKRGIEVNLFTIYKSEVEETEVKREKIKSLSQRDTK